MRLKSYKSADCCSGVDCTYDYNEEEPCWGQTTAVDEYCTEDYSDCWWVHACEGHAEMTRMNGQYQKSTYPEDYE